MNLLYGTETEMGQFLVKMGKVKTGSMFKTNILFLE